MERAIEIPRTLPTSTDLATVRVLWKRDLVRFFRQRSRVIGAFVQPLLFWAIMGSGFSSSFRIQGAEGVDYKAYFFPGILLMVILFTSIFSTMSIIEDRREGFMQAVLAAPASRFAVVLGKVLGGATLAMIQACVVLALAPLGGFHFSEISFPLLFAHLALASIGLCAIGFAIAWWLNSTQGYHAVMSVLLLPAWVVSGAMFPVANGPSWLRVIAAINPLSYAASGVRRSLTGGVATRAMHGGTSIVLELAIAVALMFVALALATFVCRRSRA
jgi:daunorubicin resistance ABC transporter membrane protein